MNQTIASPFAPRAARVVTWLALPLVAVGVLRLFPPLTLQADAGAASGWLVPVAGGLAALAGAATALLALSAAFRGEGSASAALDATAAGSLTAAAAATALAGPTASAGAPSSVLALGTAAAAIALLVSPLAAGRPLRGAWSRLAAGAAIFVWIELAPFAGLFAGSRLGEIAAPVAGLAAVLALVGVLAAGAAGNTARIGWATGIGSGILALALARSGSADAVPGLLAVAAALAAMALARAPSTGPDGAERPLELPAPAAPDMAFVDESDEALRLARELRGTISELMAARAMVELQRRELAELAEVDVDTGVATRRSILARLHTEAAEARRYAHPIALALIDLDGLTDLNGRHGTPVGDAVLRELALRLRVRIREADAIGRISGDTFLAVLPHTDERGAAVFADAVRTRLTARQVETNAGPIEMTVSIGITTMRSGSSELDDELLLARAEEALASARAAGGNRIAFDRQHGLARLDERRAEDDQDRADGRASGS